ncbi:MAG: LysR family transcriptional regulator [Acidobacteriia bacterium]|nr:LysR family transcriptional regulator [Terriglobia bacterium]
MNLSNIQIFVEVVRQGGFAPVARLRGVDPSSISRAIASLEAELGVRLLHRTTRRLSPTEAGAVYFDRVESLADELESAHLRAADVDERPKGTLRITAPVSFAELNIVPLLPRLAASFPELSFDLVLTDAMLDLVTERIDVAIRIGPLVSSGLVAYQLCPLVGKVCASPAYLKQHGRPRVPVDLKRHNCLLLDMPGFDSKWRFRGANRKGFDVSVQGRLRSSNAIALKQCALAGMGIILQARWIVGQELQEGRLVDLFPGYEVTAANFESAAAWVLYPSRSYLPLKVRVFIDFLKEAFRQGLPGDS